MTTNTIEQAVDLGQLGAHMPWTEVFADLKYPMPYPEVVMAGELAYAQFTQMNSLLMMLSWEGDSRASYTLTPLAGGEGMEVPNQVYRLMVDVRLDGYNEAWATLGITELQLLGYVQQAVAAWAMHKQWGSTAVRSVRIDETSWTVMPTP
ncbi:MAG: hypothetical protein Q4A61_05355 [Porphyromonadaceae bacterium]|nr:hypothetical protein [Porphyromonadaceae bacterium]